MTYGTLEYSGGVWLIDAKPHVMIRLRRLFPRVQSTYAGKIQITDTPEVARDLEWAMMRFPLEHDSVCAGYLLERADKHRATEIAVREIMAGTRVRTGEFIEPIRKPRAYQLAAADVVLETGNLLIVHGVGMGKTFTTLLTLRDEDALPAAVVTLGGTMPKQWLKQLGLSFGDQLKGHILTTGPLYDPQEREKGPVDVLILPYSRLAKWQDHLGGLVRTIIFDEIQELRHDGTAKYTAAMAIRRKAKYAVGATATPVYGYGGETHTIEEILSPGALGDRGEFLREWGGHQVGSVAGNAHIDEMTPLSTYMTEVGLMDLKNRKDVDMEMTEPERIIHEIDIDAEVIDKVSADVTEYAKTLLGGGPGIDKMHAATELDFRMRQATGLAKAPHVADLVELLLQSEEKILLFGWHHAVYDLWKSRLYAYRPVLYTGQQSVPQKTASLDSFITGPSRVLMMSLRAGAGLDGLQDVCSVAVFGELDWSPAIHTQNIGRVARDYTDGRIKDELCVAYFCTCDDGSDPTMMDVLGVKGQQSDQFLNPNADAVTTVVDNSDRIRQLAQAVLDRGKR